ncbi:MAG: DUF1844 domain-containing protein [Armatimonadota bacterium]
MADRNEEEKTYEVKDKRRVNPDGTLRETAEQEESGVASDPRSESQGATAEPAEKAGDQQTSAQSEPSAAESAERQASEAEMPLPRVYDLLRITVAMLAEQAWSRMGIRLAPGQKEPEKDLVQAKVAIDTIVFIVDKIAPHIEEADRKALRTLVSDLQINFVRLT